MLNLEWPRGVSLQWKLEVWVSWSTQVYLLGITCLDHIISQLFAKASLQQFGIEFCVLPTAWTWVCIFDTHKCTMIYMFKMCQKIMSLSQFSLSRQKGQEDGWR
jgi:hypothetical protein